MAQLKYTPLASNALRALVLAVVLQTAFSATPSQISPIGGPCDYNNQLCPGSAGCTNNVCKCNEDYVASDDSKSCLKATKDWQGPCSTNAQCQFFNGSLCTDGQCQCRYGQHYLEGTCWFTKHLHDTCNDDDECWLFPNQDRIECSGGRCKCKSQYHENDIGDQCNGGNAVLSLGVTSLLLTAFIQKLLN